MRLLASFEKRLEIFKRKVQNRYTENEGQKGRGGLLGVKLQLCLSLIFVFLFPKIFSS